VRVSNSPRTSTTLVAIRDRMLASPSVGVRADTAKQVGSLLTADVLTKGERRTALAILETLAKDVEQQVRYALARHVESCVVLSSSLARAIAQDVEAISLPFIRVSPALTDADLLAVIELGDTAKQLAVAGRERVSERVTDALVATGTSSVVAAVLTNAGAAVSEPSYHKIMDTLGGNETVQSLMVERSLLPLTVTERLIQSVSDALRDRLIEKHALPRDWADDVVGQAGERALMQGVTALRRPSDAEGLARRLDSQGKLSPTLLMRALCLGDIRLFRAGMAVRARISLDRAARLIEDRGPLGFKALYDKAGLPRELFRAYRVALDVVGEVRRDGNQGWDLNCVRRILDRVTGEYDEACPADLEYLLSQISHRMLGRSERPGY
jgi:uncharacterized protein (DUF2336 family)